MKTKSILSLHGAAVISLTALATVLGSSMLAGCGTGLDDLSSLGSTSTTGTGTTGGTTTGTTGGRYTGAHSQTVYKLLSVVNYTLDKGVASAARARTATPPNGSNFNTLVNGPCQSDQLVAAAITMAYGAAENAYIGKNDIAQNYANQMCDTLKQVDALCKGSNTPTFSGSATCVYPQVYTCGNATSQNCP